MVATLFANAVKKAIGQDLSVMELLSVAEQIKSVGERQLVAELYRVWISHNAENPLLFAVYFNYAVSLSANADLAGARDAYIEAVRINPDFFPAHINLGSVYEGLGVVDQAVNQWLGVVNKLPGVTPDTISHKGNALKQLGRVLEQINDVSAENALARCLEINKDQSDVIQHLINIWQKQCRSPVIVPYSGIGKADLLRYISPLSVAAYTDDPMFHLAVSHQYNKRDVGLEPGFHAVGHWAPPALPESEPKRLRIGYVSSDLRQHAIGFLTAGMFELHDRAKVEVFAYYCGPAIADDITARIKGSIDHWVDISAMTDKVAARQIIDDGIDILVDVNGYTKFARTKLFSLKPAPVIVNWLGFPGSMGSAYHNYIIADDYIIPESSEIYYAEKVKRLPCYQANDRKRLVSDRKFSRQDMGLPEDAVIYSCFNGTHKITNFTYQRWIEILSRVPNSVLWLLKGNGEANERLRQIAVRQGIAGERIIYAEMVRNQDHLARYPLADLFLDTSPYGAHTTASDALWMGVPVITLPGRSFASRVCGSLVRSAGIEDLICATPEAYVARAVELGLDKAKREAYRARLAGGRDTAVLFDTALMVRSLENLYQEMWAEYCAGQLPEPTLTNLGIYHDIAITEDHEARELLTVENYQERYQMNLAYRNSVSPIGYDGRLWTKEVADRLAGG